LSTRSRLWRDKAGKNSENFAKHLGVLLLERLALSKVEMARSEKERGKKNGG